tara:strand:- start:302 stop:430 length:129 start_codon:yes stop_codon:yes gene_type:complete
VEQVKVDLSLLRPIMPTEEIILAVVTLVLTLVVVSMVLLVVV